jgi:hypothetical protein
MRCLINLFFFHISLSLLTEQVKNGLVYAIKKMFIISIGIIKMNKHIVSFSILCSSCIFYRFELTVVHKLFNKDHETNAKMSFLLYQ